MPYLPATFAMNGASEWRWYLLDFQGRFLAESIECYASYEDAKQGYEQACLSMTTH